MLIGNGDLRLRYSNRAVTMYEYSNRVVTHAFKLEILQLIFTDAQQNKKN